MKHIFLVGCFCLFSFTSIHAQSVAENVAATIARKMKDSLELSKQEEVQIYQVNMHLYREKTIMRRKYNDADSLQVAIQRVENTRDSLYGIVLPQQKWIQYKQRKRDLVSN